MMCQTARRGGNYQAIERFIKGEILLGSVYK